MRPSRDVMLMGHAWLNATRSTCSRLQVGAVFARDGRILSMGYNGAPSSLPHCDHECNCPGRHTMALVTSLEELDHEEWCNSLQPCTTAEHAERNGIAFAARYGTALEGAELFVTHMPCLACAMSVINAGVVRVVYAEEYRLRDGIELLQSVKVKVDQITERMVG